MGSHDPFGHLKHKLWPKEGSGVNLSIWLLTIKSQESPQFHCVQVACHISLESFQRRLQLCFIPHLNRRVYTQSYGPPKLQESQFWKFQDFHLGFSGQNVIWVLVPWTGIEYIIRGKVVASPKSGPWWVLWICVCPWLVRAPKCSNYALSNLLFGLCKCVWVIELFVNLLNPIP
jgi:hypothetical protein